MDGYINICKGSKNNDKLIVTKSNFFKSGEYYIIRINNYNITFTRPNIDNNFCVYKAIKGFNCWVQFSLPCDLPLGKFNFDAEESNEDKIVVYYN